MTSFNVMKTSAKKSQKHQKTLENVRSKIPDYEYVHTYRRCEDGSLYVLNDGKNVQDRKYSHLTGNVKGQKTGSGKEPPVTAIFYSNGILLTGNKEGSVVVWNTENLNKLPVSCRLNCNFTISHH